MRTSARVREREHANKLNTWGQGTGRAHPLARLGARGQEPVPVVPVPPKGGELGTDYDPECVGIVGNGFTIQHQNGCESRYPKTGSVRQKGALVDRIILDPLGKISGHPLFSAAKAVTPDKQCPTCHVWSWPYVCHPTWTSAHAAHLTPASRSG